jgi:hypothetical protein
LDRISAGVRLFVFVSLQPEPSLGKCWPWGNHMVCFPQCHRKDVQLNNNNSGREKNHRWSKCNLHGVWWRRNRAMTAFAHKVPCENKKKGSILLSRQLLPGYMTCQTEWRYISDLICFFGWATIYSDGRAKLMTKLKVQLSAVPTIILCT